ncbi:MAG: Rossmann-like and DUF2520 domain-containing protein [Acidimicrobiia bacterium]
MRIVLVGPGRAGQSVAIAANGAGHDVVAIAARDADQAYGFARRLDAVALQVGEPIPAVDLVIVAVSDSAIEEVAGQVAPVARNAAASAVHLSGAVRVGALQPFAAQGLSIGSLHPLQTMPAPDRGARALAGAWMAVTADEPLRSELHSFASSLGGVPFDLKDENRTAYHAAAAAAANFPIAALAIAERLMAATDVPFEAARPLVEAIVANAFDAGPLASLTGPVARGDAETVAAQREAVREAAPSLASAFDLMVEATTEVAATRSEERQP